METHTVKEVNRGLYTVDGSLHMYPIQKVTETCNKVTKLYNKVTELENSSWNVLCLLRSEVAYI